MVQFITENIGTILAGLVLTGIVTAIIIRLVKRKKAGKCVACDACDGCSHSLCPSKTKSN